MKHNYWLCAVPVISKINGLPEVPLYWLGIDNALVKFTQSLML
jgi:hypothetical protein